MGGIIFGIASLYLVLCYERALEGVACGVPLELADDGMARDVRRRERCCDAQELRFTSLTCMALFAADGALLVCGALGDRVSGPSVFMGYLFLGARYPQLRAVISTVGAAVWDGSALVF